MQDDKFIDESWKDAVENEKEKKGEDKPLDDLKKDFNLDGSEITKDDVPEINFIGYITSLAFQAMIFLGEVANPLTNEIDKNLPQAKLLVDTLVLLKEKTTGNLDQNEKEALESFVYELQMKYVEVINKEGKI